MAELEKPQTSEQDILKRLNILAEQLEDDADLEEVHLTLKEAARHIWHLRKKLSDRFFGNDPDVVI